MDEEGITIGDFWFVRRQFYDGLGLWMEETGGEGMEVDEAKLNDCLSQFFKENF